MQVIPLSPQAITLAIDILAQGGVVAHATETCYGLACDLSNPQAVEKLFLIKERPFDQPVSVLFPSVDEAKKYVEWSDEATKLAQEFLPGPLTLILPFRSNAPQKLFPIPDSRFPIPSLGIRISSHPLATELAATFGKPISTTSANIHGQPNPYNAEEITRQFGSKKEQPDLVIDSGALPPKAPSKIIVVNTGSVIRN